MESVFWDLKGLLLIDYLPRRSTITGAYYSDLMVKLRQAIKTKRRGMLTRGVLLLHDNAPVHKSRVAQATINQMGFEQLAHPPYSPDLASSGGLSALKLGETILKISDGFVFMK